MIAESPFGRVCSLAFVSDRASDKQDIHTLVNHAPIVRSQITPVLLSTGPLIEAPTMRNMIMLRAGNNAWDSSDDDQQGEHD